MKSKLDKTMELIADKKQKTLGEPVKVIEQPAKKKSKPKGPTYWMCEKGHVFECKCQVHPNRKDDIHCSMCGSRVKNKSSKNSYDFYRKQTGRANELEWRRKKEREEKKHLDKIGGSR